MIKSILLFIVVMLAFPRLVLAEIDKDLRFKLGSAAASDRIEFRNAAGHGSSNNGTNAQVEFVFGPHRDFASFIMAVGLFHRQHTGKIDDLSMPTKVDYSVTGMSIAPGLRLRINDAWNFEWKGEIGIGEGQVTLNSPGVNWNATKKANYGSLSMIFGLYYLFKNSASRVGLELGGQEFRGDFEILSNSSGWTRGSVTGSNYTGNIVYGIQF